MRVDKKISIIAGLKKINEIIKHSIYDTIIE